MFKTLDAGCDFCASRPLRVVHPARTSASARHEEGGAGATATTAASATATAAAGEAADDADGDDADVDVEVDADVACRKIACRPERRSHQRRHKFYEG